MTLCNGWCKGERSATEGPAIWGRTPAGKRILFCGCCREAMVNVPIDFSTGAPNVRSAMVTSNQLRFECKACLYDTVVLSNLKPV